MTHLNNERTSCELSDIMKVEWGGGGGGGSGDYRFNGLQGELWVKGELWVTGDSVSCDKEVI